MATPRPTITWLRFCTLLPLAALFLLLVNCGAGALPPPTTPELCGGRTCGSNGDCKTNNPLCSVQATSFCLADAPRECVWKIDTANILCRCIEHDIRLCKTASIPNGNQICTANSTRTGADWSTCVACPTCTQ